MEHKTFVHPVQRSFNITQIPVRRIHCGKHSSLSGVWVAINDIQAPNNRVDKDNVSYSGLFEFERFLSLSCLIICLYILILQSSDWEKFNS